jgi:hypothetical protein
MREPRWAAHQGRGWVEVAGSRRRRRRSAMVASSAFKRRRRSDDLGCRVNGAGDRGEQGDHVGVRTEG